MLKKLSLVLVVTGSLLGGCQGRKESSDTELKNQPLYESGHWISKSMRSLHKGRVLTNASEVIPFMSLSREEVIDQLMNDPRFGDTVLDFNLYYLNRSVETLYQREGTGAQTYTSYNDKAYQIPAALQSARSVLEGGDYFSLYDYKPQLFMQKPKVSPNKDLQNTMLSRLAKVEASFVALNPSEACGTLSTLTFTSDLDATNMGVDAKVWKMMKAGWFTAGYQRFCVEKVNDAIPYVQALNTTMTKFFAAINAGGFGSQKNISELIPIPSMPVLPALMTNLTQDGFWKDLKGSSTNFNRKRSAHMLKTYLCDDLTPIGIDVTAAPGEGAHASNASCQACHYKLDPMGGLFRNYGVQGRYFAPELKTLTFDDNKVISDSSLPNAQGGDYSMFQSSWKKGTDWAVGFYVAPGKRHPQWTQGTELEDFFAFAKTAPAAIKQCLVRRMAEYFLGAQQAYDDAWLEKIATEAEFKPGAQSGLGFKRLVKSLLLSKTFAESDPVADQCYDFAKDEVSNDRPPCAIASIVEKRCASCHNNELASGGLDLSTWKPDNGGFAHSKGGKNLDKKTSLKMIKDSITVGITSSELTPSGEAKVIFMPLGGVPLSDAEKQRLFHWLVEQIGE